MLKNEKIQLENFTVERYLKVFPKTATQYLDWKIQQLWFYQVYPEGAIITSEPTPNPFKTPDTWIATTKVYLNRQDRIDDLPIIQRSAKRGPKDNSETEETVDAYTLCIIASIASALSALGFGPAILDNVEKEELSQKLLGIPATPVTETPVMPTPVVSNVEIPIAPETAPPAPRRGRPPKAKPSETPMPVEEKPVETNTAPTSPVVETSAPVEIVTPPTEEPVKPVNNSEFSSVEEARAVVCTYRNFEGTSMGTIWDNRLTDNRYQSFISWCETSDRAPAKCPKEVAALKYLKENS